MKDNKIIGGDILSIKYLKVTDLKEYENNPRHNDAAVEVVANSIKEFGFKVPIVIDKDNVIIAGHTRLKASKSLGLDKVPCIVAEDLTDEQIKAFRVADNKTSELAEWDFDLLQTELADIDNIDMSAFGFDMSEFEGEEEAEIVEDEVPAIDEENEPITRLGDIWQLGRHRLLCGDSTSAENVTKLMKGNTAKLLFTSPPYSDMREYNGNKNLDVLHLQKFISVYKPFAEYQAINLGIQRKDLEIIPYWDSYIEEAKSAGYKLMAWNVWDKNFCGSIGQQSAFFPIRHEWVFVLGTEYFDLNLTWEKKEASIGISNKRYVRQTDGTTKASSRGDTTQAKKKMESVLQCNSEQGNIRHLHPATFPVELPSEYIKAMTNKNDNVIDPFGGSGTTLIACEQLGRTCYTMELDPKYCDVIIKRWETLTGEKAERID